VSESRTLPAALLVLTFATGIVDAVSVLGLGQVFTANMTGNVVFLGFAAAGEVDFDVPRSATAILAFVAGAVLGGRLGVRWDATVPDARARGLAVAALLEAALLGAAAWQSLDYDPVALAPTGRLYAILVLCALAMGLRNATVRRLAVPDLTTTVLTLTLTGLGAESAPAGGDSPRWGRRVAAVALMAAGAAVGATLVRRGGLALPLFAVGALAVLVAGTAARSARAVP
jgi:uncharacterized membrane protein YoaK (UPF0700 family)